MNLSSRAFRAIASTVVPEAASLDEKGWAELAAIVEGAVADRPASLKRQLGLLVAALEWGPVVRFGRRFSALDEPRRVRFLAGVQGAPLLLLRRGLLGLPAPPFLGLHSWRAGAEGRWERGAPPGAGRPAGVGSAAVVR